MALPVEGSFKSGIVPLPVNLEEPSGLISQSFTGTDYTAGQSGTNKPTNLQVVLDGWLTSAGSPDFNVLVGSTKTKLSVAVAGLTGLLFNVKSYGAIGDGVADDGASIANRPIVPSDQPRAESCPEGLPPLLLP